MIRDAFLAVWLCLASVSALMFARSQLPTEEQAAAHKTPLQSLQIVPSSMMSVTDVRDGRIRGYFLSRLLFVMESKPSGRTEVPLKLLFSDAFSTVFGKTDVYTLFSSHGFDVEYVQREMKDTINTGVGFPLIRAVLVQQLDYLGHGSSQENRSRKGLTQGNG